MRSIPTGNINFSAGQKMKPAAVSGRMWLTCERPAATPDEAEFADLHRINRGVLFRPSGIFLELIALQQLLAIRILQKRRAQALQRLAFIWSALHMVPPQSSGDSPFPVKLKVTPVISTCWIPTGCVLSFSSHDSDLPLSQEIFPLIQACSLPFTA